MNKRTVKTRSYQEFQTYLVSGAISSYAPISSYVSELPNFQLGFLIENSQATVIQTITGPPLAEEHIKKFQENQTNVRTFTMTSFSKPITGLTISAVEEWMTESGFYLLGGGRGKLPLANVSAPPQKKLKAILNTDLIIKKSMRVTKVQKCYIFKIFQTPLEGLTKSFSCFKIFFRIDPPNKKILDSTLYRTSNFMTPKLCIFLGFILKTCFYRIRAKLVNQGGCCCSFLIKTSKKF